MANILCIALLSLSVAASAFNPTFDWYTPDCEATAITTDPSGNLIVAGDFLDTLTLGAKRLVARPYYGSLFIAKWNNKGEVLWACKVDCAGLTGIMSMATDSKGNIYACGDYLESITFGNTTLSNEAHNGAFLVKYNPEGEVVWAKQTYCMGKCLTMGMQVVVDNKDKVYAAGEFSDSASGRPYIQKYNYDGSLVWQKEGLCVRDNSYMINSFDIDNENNICATAWIFGAVLLGKDTLRAENGGAIIAKYNSEGELIWAQKILANCKKGTGGISTGIKTDSLGNMYIKASGMWDYMLGSDTLKSMSLMKYDKNGKLIWVRKFEQLRHLDDIVFSGGTKKMYYNSLNTLRWIDSIELGKYSIDGQTLYFKQKELKMPGRWSNGPEITTDSKGNIFIVGGFIDPAWAHNSKEDEKYSDIYLDMLSPDGKLLWTQRTFCSH